MSASGELRAAPRGGGVRARRFAVAALALSLAACVYGTSRPHDDKVSAELLRVARAEPLVIVDALERLVADGRDAVADREWAYFEIAHRGRPETAPDAFARAAAAGRIAELRGLNATALVKEVEHYGRLSHRLDPDFRDGAAKRMLGTLYVMVPSGMVRYGDSELGLEMLEELVEAHPEDLENHLRVAEGYVALGDTESAKAPLCHCAARADELRADERALLTQLIHEAYVTCP